MNHFFIVSILPGTSVCALFIKVKSRINTYGKSGAETDILHPQPYILCSLCSIPFLRSLISLEEKCSNGLLSGTLTLSCQLKVSLNQRLLYNYKLEKKGEERRKEKEYQQQDFLGLPSSEAELRSHLVISFLWSMFCIFILSWHTYRWSWWRRKAEERSFW